MDQEEYYRMLEPADVLDINRWKDYPAMYVELYDYILHITYTRLRLNHRFVNNDIDYYDLQLIPLLDTFEVVVYPSSHGYVIFKKCKSVVIDILQWVEDHPAVITGDIEYKEPCVCDVSKLSLEAIRADMRLLVTDEVYAFLWSHYQSTGSTEARNLLRISHYIRTGERVVQKGLILSGPPGVGKTYDIFNTCKDSYWLSYSTIDKNHFDGYNGQSTMIIDDIGHKSPLEWDLIIRLVNDAPWTLPVARVGAKDSLVNVSENLLVTTNNLNKLTQLDLVHQDAIGRRMDVAEYVDEWVVYKIYNIRLHRYEAAFTMVREQFRELLRARTIGSNIMRGFVSTLISLTSRVCDILQFPDISPFISMALSRLSKNSVVKSYTICEVLSPLVVYDWSRLCNRASYVKRQLRYLAMYVSDRVFQIPLSKLRTIRSVEELKAEVLEDVVKDRVLCGVTIPGFRISDEYDIREEQYDITNFVPGFDMTGITQEHLDELGPDSKYLITEDRYITRPVTNRYYKKKEGSQVSHIYADSFVDRDAKYSYIPWIPMKSKYSFEIDERGYRPRAGVYTVPNMVALNKVLHPRTVSKTKKRAKQRKLIKLRRLEMEV